MSRAKRWPYASVLLGGMAGVVAGLLLAPASGRESRRRLARSLARQKEALIRNGHRAVGEVSEMLRAG